MMMLVRVLDTIKYLLYVQFCIQQLKIKNTKPNKGYEGMADNCIKYDELKEQKQNPDTLSWQAKGVACV